MEPELVAHLSGSETVLAFDTTAIANEATLVEDGRLVLVFLSESDGLAIGITIDSVEADGVVTFASNLTSIDSHVNLDGSTLTELEVLSFPMVTAFEGSIRVGRGTSHFVVDNNFTTLLATLLSATADGADAAQDAESNKTENNAEDDTTGGHGSALSLGTAETVHSATEGAGRVISVTGASTVVATSVAIDGVSVGLAVEVVVVRATGGEVVSLRVSSGIRVSFRLSVV